MRKPAAIGMLVLLLLGAFALVWWPLQPIDHSSFPIVDLAEEKLPPRKAAHPSQPSQAERMPRTGPPKSGSAVAPASTAVEGDRVDIASGQEQDEEASNAGEAEIIVKFEGAPCSPYEAWLVWQGDEDRHQEQASFDTATGIALIEVELLGTGNDCRVYTRWFDRLLESEVLSLKPGDKHTVTFSVPEGAEIRVRVLGPDGRPSGGAEIEVWSAQNDLLEATTDGSGDAKILGMPGPQEVEVYLRKIRGSPCLVAPQTISLLSRGDFQDVVFDLSGTGIVECKLESGGRLLNRLYVSPQDRDGSSAGRQHVWLNEDQATLIYGLKPGMYKVEAGETWSWRTFAATTFEVQPAPHVSRWHKDYQTYSLTADVRGAPTNAPLRLVFWAGYYFWNETLEREAAGEFIITGLASEELMLMVSGDGWASDIVSVDPSKQGSVTIELAPSGLLNLVPRKEPAFRLEVAGIEPKRPTVTLQGTRPQSGDVVELPPGRYRVSESRNRWDPIEVVVIAGQTTECRYGREFVSSLRLYTRDRTWLGNYDVEISMDGEPVQKWRSWPNQYDRHEFEAEGKLTLRITGDGIEDYEREFEIKRDQTLTLEIELKRTE